MDKGHIFDCLFALPEVENYSIKELIVESLFLLDEKIINKVFEKIIFLQISSTTHGLFINHKAKKYRIKDFIILNECILKFKKEKQIHIVLHEVAHHILGHKNFDDYSNDNQYDINEEEADKLVKTWLRKHSGKLKNKKNGEEE